MDIDGDGILDIVCGSYSGQINYYKGSKKGFLPRQEVRQVTKYSDRAKFFDVSFTSASFGDFNDDGLQDAFVGGMLGLRVMLNQGSDKEPLLGRRIPIYQTDNLQVAVWDLSEAQKEKRAKLQFQDMTAPDNKTYMLFVDWDGDGVKDLITTSGYSCEQAPVVAFHKGVKGDGCYTFENRIPLFVAKDGSKAFPGNNIVPHVADINGDGVMDLLLGVSIAMDIHTGKISLESANSFKLYGETKNVGYVVVLYGKKITE